MDDLEVGRSLERAAKILGEIEDAEWNLENIKEKLLLSADPKNRGKLLWPLRVAFTGKEKSPSPFEVAWVLGKTKSLERINKAIEK
jgi:glutamyl/glutaminyl-tRNA synthetase